MSSAAPRQYGTSKIAHVAADDLRKLHGPVVVRPQRPPDAQQVRPQPERVAALDRARRLDPAQRSGSRARASTLR